MLKLSSCSTSTCSCPNRSPLIIEPEYPSAQTFMPFAPNHPGHVPHHLWDCLLLPCIWLDRQYAVEQIQIGFSFPADFIALWRSWPCIIESEICIYPGLIQPWLGTFAEPRDLILSAQSCNAHSFPWSHMFTCTAVRPGSVCSLQTPERGVPMYYPQISSTSRETKSHHDE